MPARISSVVAGALLIAAAALAQVAKPAPAVIYSEDEKVTGGQIVTDTPHTGTKCLRWRHGDSPSLALRGAPTDWSAYDTLTLWLRTDTPDGARFLLLVPSENAQSEGMDYYSFFLQVKPGGWQRFPIRLREDMGVNRNPVGWQKIDRMEFTATGWDQKTNPEAVVYVDDVQLTGEGPVVGPRLTDEEFFDALDLALPTLAAVKAAVDQRDYAAARTAYVQYLKARPVKWYFDWHDRPAKPADRPNIRGGEEALARRFVVCSVPYDFKGGDIDWTVNPTNPVNNEWVWQFSRHSFWNDLGRAYWDTGDEKYAKEFVYELLDWIGDCPVPVGRVNNGAGSRWRTIECGIRMSGSWPNAFFRFLSSPSFTDEAVVTMVKSMVEHARYLKQYPTSFNWLTMESNGLFHVGALFPEFKEAPEWRDTAVQRMYAELDNQVYPDGAQKELSTGYHQVSLYNFKGLLDTARLTGFDLPADYMNKLERMWSFNMWGAGPDGCLPAVNDSGYTDVRGNLREGLKYFPEHQDWLYLASSGKEGEPPATTSHNFPWAGQHVMRSGWDPQARYCFFETGPFGAGHQHEDKLSFVLSAYGSRLLIDTGIYTYDASAWRRYVLGATAHNTVLVDGQGQARRSEPRDTYCVTSPYPDPWFSTDQFDYAAGVYEENFGDKKARPATQRREIMFVKPDYWIVVDTLTAKDDQPHQYTALFHLRPAEARVLDDGRTVLTDNGAAANLAILPASAAPLTAQIIKGQKEPYLLGWTLKSGLECEPIPVATYEWQGAGVQTRAWVFYPLKPGETVLPTVTPTATGFTVRAGEKTDEVVLGDKPRISLTRHEGALVTAVMNVAP